MDGDIEVIKWAVFQPLIGGMALGAEKAFGCKPSAVISYDGVANDDLYLDYEKNVKNTNIPHFVIDGTLYSMRENLKDGKTWDDAVLRDLDVVCAVPICAGLSSANTVSSKNSKMGRGSDATQNNNMISILSMTLKHLKPKVMIFENAVKLATTLGDGVRKRLVEIANINGYGTTIVKVNTINHGLPQNRPRTFFYAWLDSNAVNLEFNAVETPTISSIISGLKNDDSGLCDPELNESNGWFKYLKSLFGKDWREKWAKDYPGAADEVLKKRLDFDYARQFFDEKGKKFIDHCEDKNSRGMNWMSHAPIWCGEYKMASVFGRSICKFVHPTEERSMTKREIMRLMGFPDDFPIPNDLGMIGQNVPVCTAEYWCKEIVKFLDGKLTKSLDKNILQDYTKSDKNLLNLFLKGEVK